MTWEDIDKDLAYNVRLLDKLDLKPFIHHKMSPTDIMYEIEDAYDNHAFSEEIDKIIEGDILKGDIFNCIGVEDFMDYLNERYGTRFDSEVTYWVI